MSKTNVLKVKAFGKNYKTWADAVAQVQTEQDDNIINKSTATKKDIEQEISNVIEESTQNNLLIVIKSLQK